MKNTIEKSEWWHDAKIKTSVFLFNFNNQMLLHRKLGGNPNKFIYNANESLKSIRNNQNVLF